MDVVDITRDLVAIDSQNPGPGEADVAAYIEEYVRAAGFGTAVRHEFVRGRPNLIVSTGEGDGPHFALSGHMDTKPIGDARSAWRTDPLKLTVVDGLAYGLGSTDMKGAIAAMLVALERFARSGAPGRASLILTADEEQGSDAGAKSLVSAGVLDASSIVVGEPSGIAQSWELLALASRGICCFEVTVRTQQGHSGLSENLPRNAVLAAMDVLAAFESFVPPVDEPGRIPAHPTVNVGMTAAGGVAFGTLPGECRVGIEIRLVPGMSRESVDRAVRATVEDALPSEASYELSYMDGSLGWMSAVELDPETDFVRTVHEIAKESLGKDIPIYAYPGGTDASYFLGKGQIPTVTSLGPGLLSVAHGPNEYVPVQDLYTAVELYTRLFESLTGP